MSEAIKNRNQSILNLVHHWFLVDPDLVSVRCYESANNVYFLQVTAATSPSPDAVVSYGFYPTHERPWPMEIAQVTPEEFAMIESRELALPQNWPTNHSQEWRNSKLVGA